MWCFFDESWPDDKKEQLVVVAGMLVNEEFLPNLDRLIYATQKKYFGEEHAKDPKIEFKGNQLLSNASFKLAQRIQGSGTFVRNHAAVKDILGYLVKEREDHGSPHYIRVFASAVFGDKPQLLCKDHKKIPTPYRILCQNISTAVAECDASKRAILIYDQRFEAQTGLAITLKGYNAGLKIANLHPAPYFGVSHASACLQISDIIVYIIARHLAGDKRFEPFYDWIRRLQWMSESAGKLYYGINSWRETSPGTFNKK